MKSYARKFRKNLEQLGLVRRRTSGGWMGAFVAGALAGAAVAVLSTPTDGKQMRKLVRSQAKHIAGSAEKKLSAIKKARANGVREQLHA